MKRLLLALFCIAISKIVFSATYTTTGNSNNWNSPSAWDCNCVPSLVGNTLNINHSLVRNGTLSLMNTVFNLNDTLEINGNLNFPSASTFNLGPTGFLSVNNFNITSASAVINLNSNISVKSNLQVANSSILTISKTATAGTLDINNGANVTGTGKLIWNTLQLSTGGTITCSSGTTFTQANPPTGTSLDLGGCVPLPVHFVSIKAVDEGYGASIYWTTSMENNNAYFQLEKSIDGKAFVAIGIVNGNGNTTILQHYQYYDASFENDAYYRIRQVDKDGRYEYSSLVFLKSTSEDIIRIENNTVIVAAKGSTNVQIVTSKGEVLFQQGYDNVEGKLLYIDLYKKFEGITIVRVATGGNLYLKKF